MKHSREFFTATGEPESQSAREQREAWETSEPVERDPETQQRLSLLNTDLIRSIITKEFVSATGLPPEQMNFIPPERVDRRTTNLGRYDPKTNRLFINRQEVERGLKNEEEKLLMTLHVYNHELGHATSRIECFDINPQDDRKTRQTNMGFLEETREELGWGSGKHDMRFHLFDEGVIEKRARGWTDEYVSRTNFVDAATWDRIRETLFRNATVYDHCVEFVDFVIDAITAHSGISREAVWDSIKRGQSRGERFDDLELKEALEELFGDGFVEDIAVGRFRTIHQTEPEALVADSNRKHEGLLRRFARLFDKK